MKSKHAKILIFSFVCLFTLAILYMNLSNSIEKQKIKEQIPVAQDYYTVKEYDGKVAVYKNNDTVPSTVFDAYTSLLPEQDRELLKQGIRVKTDEELQKVIEDFTS